MAGPVLGAGPGALLLAAIWALALLLCLALARAPGAARRAPCGAELPAFCCKPLFPGHCAGPQVDWDRNAWLFRSPQIVDTFFISRLILLAVMALVFLGCMFLLLLHHLAEPVYAKPLRSSWSLNGEMRKVKRTELRDPASFCLNNGFMRPGVVLVNNF
ncbi:transmembrane protein 218 isoform X1 [Oxyura jamaicensis]|uniref:transmembrane protein 218 isoform X1 n=1 Tax=Oxyura jamaicensis TaxID=8884 RepID=UPI0015A708F7|nr:transmembrane protein 218 isoform X1 [Oxyura jamaicensis]